MDERDRKAMRKKISVVRVKERPKELSILERLALVDEILIGYEDWIHDKDGHNCT